MVHDVHTKFLEISPSDSKVLVANRHTEGLGTFQNKESESKESLVVIGNINLINSVT